MYKLLTFFFLITLTVYAQNPDDYDENADDDVPQKLPDINSATARDFTARCMRLAQYSGEKACEVFNLCCSTDNVLSKLNGDKCQFPDSTNGCNLDISRNRIQWSQCRAYNCTEEITTTTTTTTSPFTANYAPVRVASSLAFLSLPLIFRRV